MLPADRATTRAALDAASAAGGYFAVASSDADWRPLHELITDAGVLLERVGVARDFLVARTGGDVELRACASINALGFTSRLVSPALATATLGGVVPRLTVDAIGWQAVPGGPVPLAIADVTGVRVATADEAADAIAGLVLEPVVRPVVSAYRDRFRLSPRTLWGNVSSALNGAAGMLSGARTVLDPVDVVAALLDRAPLARTGRYEPFDGRRHFVRHNCCLFYRVPAAGRCGDCVLVPEVARHDLWRATG
ncbi:(2Fe-2S)-binding protein [Jatrophihabitans fulvus]